MIVDKKNFKVSRWSGGLTKEIFIYPAESNYTNRDFQVRISSATVEVEESEFTNLPNIYRALMILSGTLEINHEGYYSKMLGKYDYDYFWGDWLTRAKGKVVDFNVMTSSELKSELSLEEKESNEEFCLTLKGNHKIKMLGLYLLEGTLLDKNSNSVIDEGNLIIVRDQEEHSLTSKRKCKYILITIK